MSPSAASRRSRTNAVWMSGRVFSTFTEIPRTRMLRRAGVPAAGSPLFVGQAAGAVLLRFLEQPHDLIAIDRVQIIDANIAPAFEGVAVFDAANDRVLRRRQLLLEGARGRAVLEDLEVEESSRGAAQVREVRDVRPE